MTTGIIVEYNPMHQGHIAHAEKARSHSREPLIAVMSGWFVQRGEPAIMPPAIRATAAVQNGVDLVFLLPVVYSIQSAEYFAQGAVDQLIAARVDRIVYGAKNPEYQPPHPPDKEAFRAAIRTGASYASALQQAGNAPYLDANTRLGLCYAQAVKARDAAIETVAIQRAPWEDSPVPVEEQNARSIRSKLLANQVPEGIAGAAPKPYASLEAYKDILTHLVFFPRKDPALFPYYEPGLNNRLRHTRTQARTVEEWIAHARSKRHTMARIRRYLLHLLLDLTVTEREKYLNRSPDALVPLAMNEKGRAYLRMLKEHIPILSTNKALHRHCHGGDSALNWDLTAQRLYSMPDFP